MSIHIPAAVAAVLLLCVGISPAAFAQENPDAGGVPEAYGPDSPPGVNLDYLNSVNRWSDLPDFSPWRSKKWEDVYTGPHFEIDILKQVIAEGIEAKRERIEIPPGIYHIRETSDNVFEPVVEIANVTDVHIEAVGVVIMAHVKCQPIRIRNSRNITLRGLTIDYAPEALPYTQGTVEEVEKNSITVKLHDGYPDVPADSGNLRKGATYDPETLLLKDEVHTILNPAFEKISQRLYRIDNRFAGTSKGDYVTMIYGIGPHSLQIAGCQGVKILGVTIHAAHMFASRGDYNHDVTYRGVIITPGPMLPGSTVPRLKSGNQDGINNHISSRILVTDCLVEAHSDDAVTLYDDDMVPILGVGDGFVYMPAMRNKSVVDVGQTIRFLTEETGGLRGQAKVIGIEKASDAIDPATRKKIISSMGRLFKPERLGETLKITLEEVEGSVNPGDWGYARFSDQGIVIVRNRFRNARGRGVVVKTNNSLIADNILERSDTFGIFVRHEGYWLSPGHVSNLTIRGNLIKGMSTRPSQRKPAAAIIIDSLGSKAFAGPGMHSNITIDHNTFAHIYQLPMLITSTSDMRIMNNVFEETHFRKPPPRGFDSHANMIYLENVSDVIVKNNVRRNTGKYLGDDVVCVEGDSERVNVEPMKVE